MGTCIEEEMMGKRKVRDGGEQEEPVNAMLYTCM